MLLQRAVQIDTHVSTCLPTPVLLLYLLCYRSAFHKLFAARRDFEVIAPPK